MAVYTIKEIEKLSGIKAHTIRIWEKRYNLIEPHRTQTNIRYYTDCDLKKILNVAVLNRQGIKISSIARLDEHELKEEIIRVTTTTHSKINYVDALVIAMIELDDYKLQSIIDKSISKTGLKDTVISVLFPFLEKVGILWQAGDVNPVQEHFVSYLIRQKIIAATNALSSTYHREARKFLLLLPEGEWHEIGLLFAQYLLKEAGHEVVYLGQSVPYSDVLAAGSALSFDAILISSTTPQPGFDLMTYLHDLGGAFPDKTIVFYSSSCDKLPLEELGREFIPVCSVDAFMEFLAGLDAR